MLTPLVIIILCNMILVVTSFDRRVNVGTVLFTRSDLQKLNWNSTELGLLKARRYFQDLLPPANFIDTANENYVNKLLRYFRDTYSTIKKETPNDSASDVMTMAFSDAVGGYLKYWLLPVTKLGFYGGTVSQSNIMKLSQFYEEVKRFLETDGEGWRSPNKHVLRETTFNIAPPRHFRRSMKDPCKELVFEKSRSGLIVPLPSVNWKDSSSTMFVPVKKHSIVHLESPEFPYALVKYYDTARSCIEETKPTETNEFEDRFQDWLVKEIMPHLCDDEIYLSFGSVLSLFKKTKDFGRKCYNAITSKIVIGGFPIDLSSKKTLLIIIILIVEIAWCIPALLYLACTRRSKPCACVKRPVCNSETTDTTPCTKASNALSNIIDKLYKKKPTFAFNSNSNSSLFQGFKLEQKPRECPVMEYETRPIQSKLSVSTKPTVSIIREIKDVPLKSSMKKIRSSHTSRSQNSISVIPGKSKSSLPSSKICSCSKCTIYGSLHNTESFYSENDTIVIENKSDVSNVKSVPSNMKSVPSNVKSVPSNVKSVPSNIKLVASNVKPITSNVMSVLETVSHVSNAKSKSYTILKTAKSKSTIDKKAKGKSSEHLEKNCPCYSCLEKQTESQVTVVIQKSPSFGVPSEKNFDASPLFEVPYEKSLDASPSFEVSCEKSLDASPSFEVPYEKRLDASSLFEVPYEKRLNASPSFEVPVEKRLDANTQAQLPVIKENIYKKVGLTLESGQPCLEIMIDKPRTEISVGIKGIFDKKHSTKPSRIPKRLPKTVAVQLTCQASSKKESRSTSKTLSLIPQPKRRPLDDMALRPSKITHKTRDNKLNVTF